MEKINEMLTKYNIKFTDNKEDIINLILSLNDCEDFNIKRISKNYFEIIYDGGYNNVYNYKVNLRIIGMTQNIHNNFFYWKFKLDSKFKDDYYIEVDNFGWETGFIDFFIGEFIKEVGVIVNNNDQYF